MNVVFILVDDLGWKDLGVYGSSFHETPNIDRLASEGVRFTAAYATAAVCSPSRASILTGKYPARLGFTDVLVGPYWNPSTRMIMPGNLDALPPDEPILAQDFKRADYATHFVGKWHLEYGTPDLRMRGFDNYIPFPPGTDLPEPSRAYRTDWYTDRAIELIEAERDQPFLLFLWYDAVHAEVAAKPELLEKYQAKLVKRGLSQRSALPRGKAATRELQADPAYAGMVEGLDQNVGRLLEKLDTLGLARNTAVILTSDNGGASVGAWAATSNRPLRAGKGWLYEGGIRVPLIVRAPGVTEAGGVSNEPVIGTDFYPTLLEMAGLPLRSERHLDGVSLVPLLEGGESLSRDAIYWHYPHYAGYGDTPAGAVLSGGYKLLEFYRPDRHPERFELFELGDDPGEMRDLSTREHLRAAELRKKLETWRRSVGARLPISDPYRRRAPTDVAARLILRRASVAAISRRADATARDAEGRGLLHFAAVSNHRAALEFLIAAGADPNGADTSGRTALHEAARRGHWSVAKLLLESGADIDARDHEGFTPLIEAARMGHSTMVRTLLAGGADALAANWEGATALDTAVAHQWREVARLLREESG